VAAVLSGDLLSKRLARRLAADLDGERLDAVGGQWGILRR
jgi:hypothetical protein